MSSLLSSGGSRAYGFDLDIVKSSSSSARSSHTSSPSSTLSESSNSSRTISIKKARTPRKRPNQAYNEAAALLSTIYPSIFSTKSTRKPSKQIKPFDSFPETSSELLPSLPVLGDDAFLIRETSPEKPAFRIEPKLKSSLEKECTSPASNELREAVAISPFPFEEDFDAESILDEEVEEGIDSIMGNLSMNTTAANTYNKEASSNCNSLIDPYLRSLMVFGVGGKFELGFGFQFRRNMQRALRHSDEGDWWRSPTVPMQEIVPKFKTSTPSSGKKKKTTKKKAEKEEVGDTQTAGAAAKPGNFNKSGLGLKLNAAEVLKAWADRGSVFADGPDSPHSSAEALAKLGDMDLFPGVGCGGGGREASVLRFKEKQRTRLFSKKIRYQVRKVNAEQRPRMKASGRFVGSSSFLQQAIEEESPGRVVSLWRNTPVRPSEVSG
ncbi:protein CHLOROPLAST IMPORT APPARATUS 2 isoform X1 [Phoenix dactylifera]|uniref:Protein CHLOROPLAST IMPORT APPARATUS 2 isoform X1 n=1 Tax=Phoenix dactylifera TaxID=42345 RepID=A0A8B7D2H4_PHODC|nr:protein CHLOROPLAST IMPORT APPARATUS 2 isoform X1 [Phoenix dactylifera]